jgi:hypothetical protein
MYRANMSLQATLGARLTGDISSWSLLPARSTVAGQVANLDSRDKSDRMVTPLGAGKRKSLSPAELNLVQRAVWAEVDPGYGAFIARFDRFKHRRNYHESNLQNVSQWEQSRSNHLSRDEMKWQTMPEDIVTYERAEYAGNIFRAAPTQPVDLVHDDSHVRYDYNERVRPLTPATNEYFICTCCNSLAYILHARPLPLHRIAETCDLSLLMERSNKYLRTPCMMAVLPEFC